jgi:subtilisin family serine protease
VTLSLPASASASWLTPAATTALQAHRDKVPSEFEAWTRYALDDGTLRVLVTVRDRDKVLQGWVADHVVQARWMRVVPGFVARITPAQLPALLASPAVIRVEPDHPLDYLLARTARDTRARDAVWSLDRASGPLGPAGTRLGALTAVAPSLDVGMATGKGVTVAVVDSGVDGTHRDFGGFDCMPSPYTPCQSRIKRQVNVDHLLGLGIDAGARTNDLVSGHGTHVAGITAGNGFSARDDDDDPRYGADGIPIGVAPQAGLVSVKNGDTLWAGLAGFGLDWVLANHAEYGIRVVNNSWGCLGGCSFNPNSFDALAIKGLFQAGVVVTFAAGNDGGQPDGRAFSGNAQSPYALGVANYDATNHQLSSSSSRGVGTTTLADPATWTPEAEGASGVRRPDLAAPGESIWSARSLTGGAASLIPRVNTSDAVGGGTNGFVPYALMSGTSMATPHVTGGAALLLSACPAATALDVFRSLMAGANPNLVKTTGGGRLGQPYEVGYGALDVRASLDWMRTHVPRCLLEQPNQSPTAVIADPGPVAADQPATLSAAGSTDADGTITGYAWDFGDGTTASGPTPTHTWTWAGSYTVRLTVTDDDGAASVAQRVVTVTDEPRQGFKRISATGLNSHKCDPSQWTFTVKPVSGDAPAKVAVVWSDGSRERIALSEIKGKTATYRTAQHLEPVVTKAWTDVPASSSASLVLDRGPCH